MTPLDALTWIGVAILAAIAIIIVAATIRGAYELVRYGKIGGEK